MSSIQKEEKAQFLPLLASTSVLRRKSSFDKHDGKITIILRLLCTFRSIIFFKSGFLSQNIGRSVIFNFKKKLLKKTKFWRRNRRFTLTPEVKVNPLIDSPMMLCNQPRRLSRDQPPRKHLPWCNYFRYE